MGAAAVGSAPASLQDDARGLRDLPCCRYVTRGSLLHPDDNSECPNVECRPCTFFAHQVRAGVGAGRGAELQLYA